MIEVRIIKEIHNTAERARMLRPHVEWCDIYGKENAFCPIPLAEAIEKEWSAMLNESRTAFKAWRNECYKGAYIPQREFSLVQDDLLYRNGRHIWFVERWGENGAGHRTWAEELQSKERETLQLLASKNISRFIEEYILRMKGMYEATEIRDRNIAENLNASERLIRGSFPYLKDKEVIKLAVGLGYSHKPERFMHVSPEIVELAPISLNSLEVIEELNIQTTQRWRETGQISERDALAHAIARLPASQRFGLNREELILGSSDLIKKKILCI
ncbi:MAG: hypothetical protein AABX11_03395 [Nanoarchaeota archaeon]